MSDLMEREPTFENHKSFAFVFAHPDDEIYTAATMHRLCSSGKSVSVMYLTNGDGAGPEMAAVREEELWDSMGIIGVDRANVRLLGVSEHDIFDQADEVLGAVSAWIWMLKPDVVVGHDWEGGHNMHDFASFCGSYAAQLVDAEFDVFAAYHGPPEKRRWNRFVPGRSNAHYKKALTRADGELKKAVIGAHASQAEFFQKILTSDDRISFMGLEELRDGSDIDFRTLPTNPVGYEAQGDTSRFDALQTIIDPHILV